MHVGLNPELWRGRRVLITGHTGFKGCWLTAWLSELGADILGYSLPPEEERYRFFRGSGLDKKMLSTYGDVLNYPRLFDLASDFRPQLVLHLAAQALVRQSYVEPVGTFAVNVMGTAHVLELTRQLESVQATVVITTDKCYENREWIWAYRENDRLGGHDPYSNSKACAELVTDSYRRSFLAEQGKLVATARAGNVIGGGDLAEDRLVPDTIRAFESGRSLAIRTPGATRPWQHVLDPLHGYLLLAQGLLQGRTELAEAFNFGPIDEHTVGKVVQLLVEGWGDGAKVEIPPGSHPHEASRLHLDSRKAQEVLGWQPRFDFETALDRTLAFYKAWRRGTHPLSLMRADLQHFQS